MKIKLASSYGFCFGVKRAIKIAENEKNASTIGPLIHNNEEITRLRINFNVDTLEDINQIEGIKKAIIRTHGIPKEDLKTLRTKGVDIIDATCPYVTKPQKICEKMSKEGYDIVIFGDENHPEVKGVKSYAEGPVFVVLNVKELSDIKLGGKVAVVSQTTRKAEEFAAIVSALVRRHKEVRVFNTICNATLENQDATRTLSKEADIMIVIGGKNSSNTKQLLYIAKEYCKDSHLVESDRELEKKWFVDKKICGISAGASTPDWIINKIIEKISQFKV
ncbi:MAG: 4-hydroxy-3-methylbut-2-enyl diphosphate reductase [Campylobacteraceae bacterium]|nr:4-hydroxy-3-methylbut-2-enyl diphosphate reductase [Campylobacteraceae bacterium]